MSEHEKWEEAQAAWSEKKRGLITIREFWEIVDSIVNGRFGGQSND